MNGSFGFCKTYTLQFATMIRLDIISWVTTQEDAFLDFVEQKD